MRKAFTLIELLVVIAILAVLAVVVVLTLNPAGLLQESRDSTRLQDMATLNNAISYSLADNAGENIGSANTVYVSIPDPTATTTAGDQCQGLGLPSLPPAYTYQCAASSTYRMSNGTGWIPINLSANTFGSSLAQLPIDPVNQSSSRRFYTYETDGNGKFETTAAFESSKYQLGGPDDQISQDGGTLASVYEKGSKLGLEPLDYGDTSLVGYWTFDEGTGSVAYDYSGNNATGSWNGTGTHYVGGKVGSYAGQFASTTSDFVNVPSSPSFSFGGTMPFTFIFWGDDFSGNSYDTALTKGNSGICAETFASYLWEFETNSGGGCPEDHDIGNGFPTNTWVQVAGVYDGSNMLSYKNGVLLGSLNISATPPLTNTSPLWIGKGYATQWWNGYLDDVRIYNRALSAAQIAAMYNGGK